ncbi:hypothetical protein A2996_03265 [Candidatus Campbellbacteria bacterium RIFCSPLOWO2_01_FULL_34_15]|uniref:Uncharacterized protein n=2 Tax=Candidatus Campbelliibacteriota TaxID=1752727 RepID=A0A1F5EPL9_9BACT|nr:MAG: hypothetical protein A2811_03160 [Candidatus Campbellbacteria bacterium RIFCSPHIGHO2_01_FULL_34_10]OGD69341.1 MAG: hypothetical protein A2996_03265 [Candidatus Campbellbacteria bacterium RIFCSPLOWO2_01_FULL_34_15]
MPATERDWKNWQDINGNSEGLSPTELMNIRYRHGRAEAVRAITCPPGRDPQTWEDQIQNFLVSKEFGHRVH